VPSLMKSFLPMSLLCKPAATIRRISSLAMGHLLEPSCGAKGERGGEIHFHAHLLKLSAQSVIQLSKLAVYLTHISRLDVT
jgi:hypothetical protein